MKNERKEELKDEMKNRISLALKDPILQQGFEVICKENAELKARLKYYSEQICNKECAEVWGELTEAKEHIKKLLGCLLQDTDDPRTNYYVVQYMTEAEQFLKEALDNDR